jgi:hypothetical protein
MKTSFVSFSCALASRSWALVPLALLAFSCSDGGADTALSGPGSAAGAGAGGVAGEQTGGGATSGASAAGGAKDVAGGGASSVGGAGGATAGKGGGADTGGSAGDTAGEACTSNNDCVSLVPQTKPADCARGVCTNGACHFVAKDFDGDGEPTNKCAPVSQTDVIELGADCDDSDPKISPQQWDGPAGTVDGVAVTDRCDDGVDNDCSGVADDGKLPDGTTCTCIPGDVRSCGEDSSGKAIPFPPGPLQGLCKRGSQTCVDSGKWGPCTDSRGPAPEQCDAQDNDCDGETDEIADIVNAPTYFCDGDGDGFTPAGALQVRACLPPENGTQGCAGVWRPNKTFDDCDDADVTVSPGATEICDGKDNNCTGTVDENLPGIGASCNIAGLTKGACLGGGLTACTGGKVVCAGPSGVVIPSKDFHSEPAPNGSWDWECDGDVDQATCQPDGCGNKNSESACNYRVDCGATCGEGTRYKCKWVQTPYVQYCISPDFPAYESFPLQCR